MTTETFYGKRLCRTNLLISLGQHLSGGDGCSGTSSKWSEFCFTSTSSSSVFASRYELSFSNYAFLLSSPFPFESRSSGRLDMSPCQAKVWCWPSSAACYLALLFFSAASTVSFTHGSTHLPKCCASQIGCFIRYGYSPNSLKSSCL